MLRQQIQRFARARGGNFGVIFGLTATLLMGVGAGAVDYVVLNGHEDALQSAADSAALAAIREAGLNGFSQTVASQVADRIARANYGTYNLSEEFHSIQTTVDVEMATVTVVIEQDHYPFFTSSFMSTPQLRVTAVAAFSGQQNLCMLVLKDRGKEALKLDGSGRVTADDCIAHSNSTDKNGITAERNTLLATVSTCSAGGYKGSERNYLPVPNVDCTPIEDPLASRIAPLQGLIDGASCDHTRKTTIDGGTVTLNPATYCDELKIKGGAVVTFRPGNYIFKDAKLKVEDGAEIRGRDVGFLFQGDDGKLEIKNDTKVQISGREDGTMAGLLVFADPDDSGDSKIESRDARELIGTIYMPGSKLTVGGDEDGDGSCDVDPSEAADAAAAAPGRCDAEVGDRSDWTAIVVEKLHITNGARLSIQSNYDLSSVPVPQGIGPDNGTARLVR